MTMADEERRVSIVAWPEQAAQLEHTFCKDEPCNVMVSFADTPAQVVITSSPELPLNVDMNMNIAARRPIPVCITLCEPICAKSDYTIGIRIFNNPFADIDVRGVTRFFQCKDKPVEQRTCVDFDDIKEGTEFDKAFTLQGVTFEPLVPPLRAVTFGDPAGAVKLALPTAGVRIAFAQPVKDVLLTVNNYAGRTLDFTAYSGATVVAQFSAIIDNEVREIPIDESGVTAVVISRGNNEAGLVKVCYTPMQAA